MHNDCTAAHEPHSEAGAIIRFAPIPMEKVRPALQKFAVSLLRGVSSQDAALLAWPLACGQAVASRTQATAFRGGRLQVRVPDRSWRATLFGLVPHYLNVLHQAGVEVKEIEFIVPGERVS